MSNYEDINYRTGSEPRRRRMSRYGEEEPAAQSDTRVDIKAEKPAEPAQPSAGGDTTRAPRVYDSYRETEAAARSSRSTDDALLQQRSRAFEKQAQHTGVYTRMTQTGYHQTIRQPQRAEYEAPADDGTGVYADRRCYEEYQAPQNDTYRRESYPPAGQTSAPLQATQPMTSAAVRFRPKTSRKRMRASASRCSRGSS